MKIQSSQHMYALFPKSHSLRMGLLLGLHSSKDSEGINICLGWEYPVEGPVVTVHLLLKLEPFSGVFLISGCVRIFIAYKC